jgi:ATP-dependent DNA helicase
VCEKEVEVKSEEEVVADDGSSSLVLKSMVEEEEKLLKASAKEEEELYEEAPNLNDSQFNKLDELLTQTKLYSEFLLEKMDDITLVFPF